MPGKLIVGLTGGIGSGKSTVAELFRVHGIDIIDADVVAHALSRPGTSTFKEIVIRFGKRILAQDGTLDRGLLRTEVFQDPVKRKQLESIMHPPIRREMARLLAESTSDYVIFVIPLLVETQRSESVDRILVVDAPETLQMARTVARDGSSAATVQGIIDAQATRQERLALADDVIRNDVDFGELANQVECLHQNYLLLEPD